MVTQWILMAFTGVQPNMLAQCVGDKCAINVRSRIWENRSNAWYVRGISDGLEESDG